MHIIDRHDPLFLNALRKQSKGNTDCLFSLELHIKPESTHLGKLSYSETFNVLAKYRHHNFLLGRK